MIHAIVILCLYNIPSAFNSDLYDPGEGTEGLRGVEVIGQRAEEELVAQ